MEKHEAHCTTLHYSPAAPHDLAVTCGGSIAIRSGLTGAKLRAISRFNGAAHSGQFRCAGGDSQL